MSKARTRAASSPSPTQYDVVRGESIRLDHDGSYEFKTSPAPMKVSDLQQFGAGYAVEGGSATIANFHLVPQDTPQGVVFDITFDASNRAGSPALRTVRTDGCR